MLQNEREEVANQLELDVPNLEVERRVEPMLITIQLTRSAQVKIKWNIIWVAKNERLRYNISVICEEEGKVFSINYLQIYTANYLSIDRLPLYHYQRIRSSWIPVSLPYLGCWLWSFCLLHLGLQASLLHSSDSTHVLGNITCCMPTLSVPRNTFSTHHIILYYTNLFWDFSLG